MQHREMLRAIYRPQTDVATRRGKVQLLLGGTRQATRKRAGPTSLEHVVGRQPEHAAPCQTRSGPPSPALVYRWGRG
jgi:hypothetical protein